MEFIVETLDYHKGERCFQIKAQPYYPTNSEIEGEIRFSPLLSEVRDESVLFVAQLQSETTSDAAIEAGLDYLRGR